MRVFSSYIFHIRILWIISFAVSIYFLGFGAALLIFLCLSFGIREYKISGQWGVEKKKQLSNGIKRENLREDVGLMKRYALCVYIPMMLYCITLYVISQICEGNAALNEKALLIFSKDSIFQNLSKILYPVISSHADAIALEHELKAEIISRMYTILFNMPYISMLSFSPSLLAWIKQSYFFETRGYTKPICLFGMGVLLINLIIWFSVEVWFSDAPLYFYTRRFSYDVLKNENFWILQIVLSYLFFLSFSYGVPLLIAYAKTYLNPPFHIYLKKEIFDA